MIGNTNTKCIGFVTEPINLSTVGGYLFDRCCCTLYKHKLVIGLYAPAIVELILYKKFRIQASIIIRIYKKYGINFSDANGEVNGANLPVPAVYVINKEGKIVYKYFNTDYSKRSSVKDILTYL